MFFNKLTYPLIFAVLLVAGLAFIVAICNRQLPRLSTPVLSVPDEVEDVGPGQDDPTQGIQSLRYQS